jgi:hypothetical protein
MTDLDPQSSIAIVILSCDKFSITWKPCIDHIYDAWPDCSYPIYLLNNFKSSNDPRVIDLLVGEDKSWSDSVIKGLNKIPEKRVLFIYDDTFLIEVPAKKILEIIDVTVINNLDAVSLRRKRFDRGTRFNHKLYKIDSRAKYRTSLFLNLIKVDLLINLLKTGESAWQFEKDGNIRSFHFDFYSAYEKDLVKYHHGIVKGKWFRDTYQYIVNKGYSLEENTFPILSYNQMISMKIYTFFWYIGQYLLHRFNYFFKIQ